ncbi:hypothetical protein B0H14DRAFT_112825 [Mycena olivaceomarginata]|nr:hypothetical protein B0H14DRAFT_112825 [Mycena olivaceomarginata]
MPAGILPRAPHPSCSDVRIATVRGALTRMQSLTPSRSWMTTRMKMTRMKTMTMMKRTPLQDEMDKDGEGSEDENARKPQPDAPLVNLHRLGDNAAQKTTLSSTIPLSISPHLILSSTPSNHVVICLSGGIAVELGSMEVEHMEARVSRSWWEGALWREIQEVLAVRRGGWRVVRIRGEGGSKKTSARRGHVVCVAKV